MLFLCYSDVCHNMDEPGRHYSKWGKNVVLKRQLLCNSSCWVPADRGVTVESGVGLLRNNLPLHHSLTVYLRDMGICDSSRWQHFECTCCERANHRDSNLGRDREHSRVNYLQKMKTNWCHLWEWNLQTAMMKVLGVVHQILMQYTEKAKDRLWSTQHCPWTVRQSCFFCIVTILHILGLLHFTSSEKKKEDSFCSFQVSSSFPPSNIFPFF